MDGVGKGKLGMITIFCRSDQVEVGLSDALSTLVQWDSSKPGVVVVKVFTNLPYLPWGSFGPFYLNITTLSVGTSTTQFPTCLVHMHRFLPYSPIQVILPQEKEGDGLKIYPFLLETLWESLEEGASFVSPFATVSPLHFLSFPLEM